jgi:hypothetical protein
MIEQNLYVLDDDELMAIDDLCEGLSLAINKIIRRRRLVRENYTPHPAVTGYQDLVRQALFDEDGDDGLTRLF